MKITKISAQLKRSDAYSIFVDEIYSFSLSSESLLRSKLILGQILSESEVASFKQQSDDDKCYSRALQYAILRPRSCWELERYLIRKKTPTPLIEQITNKLQELSIVDDRSYAAAYVHDRLAFRPTSRRKITAELKQRHVGDDVIREVFEGEESNNDSALLSIIEQKRRQTRYQDDIKLMQYLSRQGFGYQEIKVALLKADA